MARIYQTSAIGDARIRVALVNNRDQADLLVHRVDSWGMARGDGRWYITTDKQEATCWVFFTSIGMAQIKVCFVDVLVDAGWVRDNPFKGKL